MTTWQDHFGVVYAVIRVAERAYVVWDTVCFYAVRIRHIDVAAQPQAPTCLFCVIDELWDPNRAIWAKK